MNFFSRLSLNLSNPFTCCHSSAVFLSSVHFHCLCVYPCHLTVVSSSHYTILVGTCLVAPSLNTFKYSTLATLNNSSTVFWLTWMLSDPEVLIKTAPVVGGKSQNSSVKLEKSEHNIMNIYFIFNIYFCLNLKDCS